MNGKMATRLSVTSRSLTSYRLLNHNQAHTHTHSLSLYFSNTLSNTCVNPRTITQTIIRTIAHMHECTNCTFRLTIHTKAATEPRILDNKLSNLPWLCELIRLLNFCFFEILETISSDLFQMLIRWVAPNFSSAHQRTNFKILNMFWYSERFFLISHFVVIKCYHCWIKTYCFRLIVCFRFHFLFRILLEIHHIVTRLRKMDLSFGLDD